MYQDIMQFRNSVILRSACPGLTHRTGQGSDEGSPRLGYSSSAYGLLRMTNLKVSVTPLMIYGTMS